MAEAHRSSLSLRYRLLAAGDAEAVHHVALESWRYAYGAWLPRERIEEEVAETYSPRELDGIRVRMEQGEAAFWVAVGNGRVVGFASVGDRGEGWELVRLYVLPSHFGLGVGSQLLWLSEQFVRGKGADAIFCYAHPANERAMRFYAHRGFTHVPERDKPHLWHLRKPLRAATDGRPR